MHVWFLKDTLSEQDSRHEAEMGANIFSKKKSKDTRKPDITYNEAILEKMFVSVQWRGHANGAEVPDR